MPPKKEAKKGAVQGNYKAGKPLKDILPPGSKANREGQIFKCQEEPNIKREFQYEAQPQWPEWPGNEEAAQHDFTSGCQKDAEGNVQPFEDENCKLYLPPSFKSFCCPDGQPMMLRPDEYIREVLADREKERLKREKRKQIKARKNIRMQNIFSAMGGGDSEAVSEADQALADKHISMKVKKEEIEVKSCVIQSQERLETEEEVLKRKAAEEAKAEADKKARKKPAAKGGKEEDQGDKPQMVLVPVENSLDLGFSMPLYTKWVTSQFQLCKDRSMVDCESEEKIWQRIYPQENGTPVKSPSGKYWVKMRVMGKERLIEIDDTMPCDYRGKPILARTINILELWPQLLMKAIMKVYSYKWFNEHSYFDKEVGDGSIIYSLTGMIPEHIKIKDFHGDSMPMFRHMLSDEYYFGRKTYLTCFCENEFRPKLPSQQTLTTKKGIAQTNEAKANMAQQTEIAESSPSKMLSKLKDHAALAISVTTGKKLAVKKSKHSNVIPGFGYAMMDLFENQFVDMESIVNTQLQVVEETRSPFSSPKKKERSPLRDGSITKEEYRRKRKDERQNIIDARENREKKAPTQFNLIQVKTAVGNYPTINYISPFSNDEIMQGKRCLQNHFKRPPEVEQAMKLAFDAQTATKTRRGKAFAISVSNLSPTRVEEEVNQLNQPSMSVLEGNSDQVNNAEEEKKEEVNPVQRPLGGVWLNSSDFPFAFTDVIVYHDMTKYKHKFTHSDLWSEVDQPYIPDEKEYYIKMELDEEAFEQYKQQRGYDADMTVEQMHAKIEEESKTESLPGYHPGQKVPKEWSPDKMILAFTPQPTKTPYDVLPRYMMRLNTVDLDESITQQIDSTFLKYMEGIQFRLCGNLSAQKTIWLKAQNIAPQGYTMYASSNFRNISIVPKSEYMVQHKEAFQKQYTLDFLPLKENNNHLFAKYDFRVPEDNFAFSLNMNCSDKYLLDYLRIKIVDKSQDDVTLSNAITFNTCNINNAKLPVNDDGYTLIVEGAMPYNTSEGQIQIDVLSNSEQFELVEIVGCEPVEYTDSYTPSKYGIIFKEKIFTSPSDPTLASINVRLSQNAQSLNSLGLLRYFKVQVLDNDECIFEKKGWNQINLSNFVFRMNAGLPEKAEDGEEDIEVKHNYVVQAIFDLNMWPECATVNEETEGVSWAMKWYTSETLALVKDTDKEDREKALKASWEATEPGRADKASASRRRFQLQKKQRSGEELTEEELGFLAEKRERVRKKDMEEQLAAKPGAKKAPPKADPKKAAAKGAPAATDKVVEEEQEQRALPQPEDHINTELVSFLTHFKQPRLITVASKGAENRKRPEEEKEQVNAQRQAVRDEQAAEYEKHMEARNQLKETRETYREALFAKVEAGRNDYKGNLQDSMEKRTGYRDMIQSRKEKEKALLDLLAQDKVDLGTLTAAIEAAKANLVTQRVIDRAIKTQDWLKYCKEVEGLLQAAIQEKVKENLAAVIERIEQEKIVIEPKILQDAKNIYNKMK